MLFRSIVSKAGDAPRRIRLSADAEVLAMFPADAARLRGNEGYAVRPDGDDLCLFGTASKGVLNGVYRLLRRNTDIIWARPNEEIGTIFTVTPTLTLWDADHIDVPVFGLRGWKTSWPLNWADFNWTVRQCANWGTGTHSKDKDLENARPDWGVNQERYFGHNTSFVYMPRELYWTTHPEWYSMRNGKRVDPVRRPDGAIDGELCFSNPEMTAEFCRRLDRIVVDSPKSDCFAVFFEDNWDICECPNCVAPINLQDGRVLTSDDPAFASTRFFLFLNQVARFLKERHPGKTISTEAYHFAEIPPAIPLEDNIHVILCPIYKDVKHPMNSRANEYSWRNLNAWAAKKPSQLVMFEYYGYGSDYPIAMDFSAAGDMRCEAEQGVHGLFSEVSSDTDMPNPQNRGTMANLWDNNAMYLWVVSQLMWDPYQDVLALRRDFLRRVFGDAAADVEEYLSYLEYAWKRTANGSFFWSNGDNAWFTLGRLGFIPRCGDALARARSRRLSAKSRMMLERLAASFESSMMVANFERCQAFSAEQRSNPDRHANLIQNGGFEIENADKPAFAQADWNATGFKEWSVWSSEWSVRNSRRNIEFGIARGQSVDGSNCVFMGSETTPRDTTGELCGGPPTDLSALILFIQELQLTPGQSYIVRVQTRQDNLLEAAPKLSVRFRPQKGGWEIKHDLQFFASPTRLPGEWSTIEGFFTIPEGYPRVNIQIGCANSRGRVYFDNVELYLVE